MDKIYTDPNMENDNTDHIRRKRLSSILKVPRNPLHDLGNGNEMTQDIPVERRRRSSRRVSFANTINCRVFQRDLKNSTSETENTGCSADEKDDTLPNQNEDPGVVPCEITGMNTLLHAPIQALGQQTEWRDLDQAASRTDRKDTTLLFSEENEMEMTASHTAMISRNLRAHQPDGTEKIDFTSFLARLNSSQGKAETSKELSLLSYPTNHPGPSLEQKEEATTLKKIDFNEFLLRLKSNNPAERPDKGNVCCVPSQGLGDVTRLSGEFGYSHELLDTRNVTKVFRGQEGGMEMTKCEATDVKIPLPGVSEVPPEPWECADVTEAFADEGMDVTTSHTAKVSFALSTVENQSLNFQKDFPPTELDNSMFRRASNHDLNVQQDPQLCADRKTANAEGRGDPPVLRAGKQEARALSAIQESILSETIFQGDKTVVFSKCDDMEMTGNYTAIINKASTTEKNSSCHKSCEKPVSTNPPLTGTRSLAYGDIPKCLAPRDNLAAGPYKISAMELPSASGGHMENTFQAHGPAAASTGFGSYMHLVPGGVLKTRFDPSASPQLVFSGEKTVMFAVEDMDLAKTYVKDGGDNVDNEHPTAAFTSVTSKPHFLGNRSTSSNVTEQEEMEIIRCHTVFFDGRSSGITAELKQMPCKIIPRKNQNKNVTEGDISAYSVGMDKENVEVRNINGNIKKSQAMERNAQDIWMIIGDKKLGKTNFQASGRSSCAKSMCLLQEQNRGDPENVVTNTSASLSLQSQVVSQPLEINLPSLSDFCTNNTTGVFLGDQSMDITKAHAAAFEIAPINTEQESNYYNQNTALSMQLQNQPFPFSSHHGVDIVSQTAAMECGDLKMNTSKEIVTFLAPSGSFAFSNNPSPSGMRGNEQFGTIIGINADSQNSKRQEKPQPVRAVSKILPTQGDSDRHFSMRKTGSLRRDLKTPSAHGLLQRGAEQPAWARTSEAPKGSSQLSFFGEKSVVFPHGENMDMTGRCVVMVPDYSINVVLSENKAAPGCFGQGENETISLEKGATTTTLAGLGGWEAAGGRTISFALAQDMEITTTQTAQHRQPIPAIPADKTIVFAHDQEDMDITASHTVAVSKNICGFEAQQVPHTNTQQPPHHMHSRLVPCSGEMDSSQYATKHKDKPSIPSSAPSDSAFPSEKGATQVPSGTTPHSIYFVSLRESTVDVGTPQDHGLPTDNSVSREQDLTPPEKLQSKGVSSEFPSKGTVDHREESGSLESCVVFPMQGSDPWKGHPDAPSTQRNQLVEEDSSRCGGSDFGLAGANLIPAANKESKKNEELSAEGAAPPKHFQKSSEKTQQPLVSDSSEGQAHPTLLPAASGVLGVCSKLIDLTRKSVPLSKTAFSDQLPSSSAQPEDTLRLGKNTVSEANNFFDTKKQENTGLESGADPIGMTPKDKYPGINIPLGIFQPKLPNKRNHVSSAQDISAKSDRVEDPVPANTSETPGNKSSRQNFSPFQFIAEEFLPVCLEEMDSNESVSSELMENAWDDKNKKQIPHSEKGPFEETKTCNMKRALGQTEEDLQSPKKAKGDHVDAEASQDLEDQAEVDEAGGPPNLSAKSPECPQASTSSSLDSVKADIESTIQRSSQVESHLLTDSICEENLWEKFQNGAITVGEFFTLLQVHVVIQKPRHSQLPATCAVSAPPTAEDLIYSQYIHRPKLRIYEEDCQNLSWKIVELKPHVTVLDQPLVNVIRSLWEVMRTCTDEELSKFGAELNKMKSCFTKEAKILSHNEKETLYRKLLQSAEEQYRKLQSRIEKVDDWMKEAENSMVALVSDSFWDEEEAGCSAGTAGRQNVQEELRSITAQEEELLRELSEMDAEDELDLAEMEKLKKTERACLEILKKYDFTEWELMEWSDQQAVFNFLYDSVTLTVVFGSPVDGECFAAHPSRSIISLDFDSFLDEEQASPSSCLVQRLIFQFIESRGSWQDKCPTLRYLPQALFDISLVVNRCRILGEELEFLQRWGAKFHLLETDIKDTEVKLLFSSSVAFAKFDLTLAVSHDYPSAVLPFRVQTHIGNIGEKEIAAVLSRVPAGHHYLQRIVIWIDQNLLQGPRRSAGSTGRTEIVKMGSL